MKTYKYSYYLSDFPFFGLIDAENEADCILKLIKRIPHPEIMNDLVVGLYNEPSARSKNNALKAEPKVTDTHVKDLIKNLKAQLEEYEECIDHYETRNLELVAKNDELETQLLQYKIYVSDITTAIQKNICKNFCPNIGQPT